MLSKKLKAKIKKIAINTTLAISTVVVLFVMCVNLDGRMNSSEEEQYDLFNNQVSKAGNQVEVIKDSNGISVKISANDSDGVRNIEVLQSGTSVGVYNFSGSNTVEEKTVGLSIPFGQTQDVVVKVNGNTINTKTIKNTRYISSTNDMVAFRNTVNAGDMFDGKYIELLNDITLSGAWTPIGTGSTSFNGIFDGNGHTISGLSIDNSSYDQGLFAYIGTGGIVRRVTVRGSVKASGSSGGIAGWNYGRIELCTNYATITVNGSPWKIGGICGTNYGVIAKCINYGSISGYDTSGGIAGLNNGTIEECVNKGSVYTSYLSSGGIAGINGYRTSWTGSTTWGAGRIYNCYNTASVTGGWCGGLVGAHGYNESGAYSYVYNSYTITTTNYVGNNVYGTTTNCFTTNASSNITALNNGVDRLDGTNYDQPWVADSYGLNGGYPILKWQIPSFELNIKQTYMNVGETIQLVADTSKSTVTLGTLTWASDDSSVAVVDSTGKVTAIGEGYTTVYAVESKYTLKAMAIINVAKSGAIAYSQVGNSGVASEYYSACILKEDGTVWRNRI